MYIFTPSSPTFVCDMSSSERTLYFPRHWILFKPRLPVFAPVYVLVLLTLFPGKLSLFTCQDEAFQEESLFVHMTTK